MKARITKNDVDRIEKAAQIHPELSDCKNLKDAVFKLSRIGTKHQRAQRLKQQRAATGHCE